VESEYCPICAREVESIEHEDEYLLIHDNIYHSDEDLEALSYGIQ
jgi:hypothetical protein